MTDQDKQKVVDLYNKKYDLAVDKEYTVFVRVNLVSGMMNGMFKPTKLEPDGESAKIFNGTERVKSTKEQADGIQGGKSSRKRRLRKGRSTMKN